MCDESVVRRSANYQPPIWGYDYVQSLRNQYVGESYGKRIEKLKGDARIMLKKVVDVDLLHQLELVDTLQRLECLTTLRRKSKESPIAFTTITIADTVVSTCMK
ncbi:+limonene synthase [Melia azedarach]|uniref:+limonene synthase n=1 Tax=Melia azedarach TaxID=155640 RepID=A0ACC1WZS1_MELAZ|nr:+limonene synthase [Melia azedarach]